MRKTILIALLLIAGAAVVAPAQTPPATQPAIDVSSKPASEPATQPSPLQKLDDLLKPSTSVARPLQPAVDTHGVDKKSASGAVAPNTPAVALQREGTFIFDRVGRLTHSADGSQAEFTFEADGKTLKDPPVVILPNLKLMTMEDAVKATNRDLRFRVTGMLTEYRGRNYLLLEKVLVPPEGNAQF
jgi:hypothetical protein